MPIAVAQVAERRHEGALLFDVSSFDRRRVFDAPMRRHRLAGPNRTCFARRAVADGEDEIHSRRAGPANSSQLFER